MSAATVAPATPVPTRTAPPAVRSRALAPVRSTDPPARQPPDPAEPRPGFEGDHGGQAGPDDAPEARAAGEPAPKDRAEHEAGDGASPGPPGRPRLRALPVPIREPYPLHRIRTLEGPVTVGPAQGTLPLTATSPGAAARRDDRGAEDRARQEWVVTFVHAALEVSTGVRSPAQLVRWTGLEVHAMLVRRGALAARARAAGAPSLRVRPVVRAARMSSPVPGAWEVAIVVQTEDKVRAVALRLEELDGRRRVTELEIG